MSALPSSFQSSLKLGSLSALPKMIIDIVADVLEVRA